MVKKTRRGVIYLFGSVTILPTAGCMAERSPQETPSDNNTQTTGTSTSQKKSTNTPRQQVTVNPSDPIHLDIHNDSSVEQKTSYSIIKGANVITEGKEIIPVDEYISIETHITESGKYKLNISTDNLQGSSYSFQIGDYEIRMGSNLVAWIRDNGIQIAIEE